MKNKYQDIQNTKANIDSSGIDWRTKSFSHPERTIRLGTSFSGIGAIEHSFHRLGLNCKVQFAGDIDENCKKAYFANYHIKEEQWHKDIHEFDATPFKSKVDLFVGGAPCQAFSLRGKHGGFEDTRGTLFREFARVVIECQPKVFIFENVRGMLYHDKGNTWDVIHNTFENDCGYQVYYQILNSKDYGVPQNRERVLFIGCRKDQPLIDCVPATISEKDKVTVYEAISDLDFIENGEEKTEYENVNVDAQYSELLRHRKADSSISRGRCNTLYSDWCRNGRLGFRFNMERTPFYVKNLEDLETGNVLEGCHLFNHQTSQQNDDVKTRLEIIVRHGEYDDACKDELRERNVMSNKRNYTVLNPKGQSPTVVTMPDDFIHYSACRAMTVREMARLQSFDDSFVFQGKRTTGGEMRKRDIPQYTLVGNAVPPLMAKAIGDVILKNIR